MSRLSRSVVHYFLVLCKITSMNTRKKNGQSVLFLRLSIQTNLLNLSVMSFLQPVLNIWIACRNVARQPESVQFACGAYRRCQKA